MSNRTLRIVKFYEQARSCSTRLIQIGFLALSALATKPAQATTLCVLVPHFKDEYWLGVGYGLEQEAQRRGVDLLIHEAGGYRARSAQIDQIDDCVARKVDAILLGTVSSNHPDMLKAVRRASVTTPVLALVNELQSPDLAGAIGVNWRDMGAAVGKYLSLSFPAGGRALDAVLISGPAEAGWTAPLETGLRKELVQSGVQIVATYGGDTGLTEQFDLVERALRDHPKIDLIIGSAPAIEAAMGIFGAQESERHSPVLVATYVTHTIKRGLMSGKVAFAPFDNPQQQGNLAISEALSFLTTGQKIGLIGPAIRGVTARDRTASEMALSPPDYFPAIN